MTRRTLVLSAVGATTIVALGVWLTFGGDDARDATSTPAPEPTSEPTGALTPAPPPTVSAPVVRTLETPEGRHVFEERLYTPELPLTRAPSRPPASWLTTPEAVVSSLFSAMQANDWDWAMSLFDGSDPEWRARVEADRATYLASWPTSFAPYTFTLTKQHVVSGYTIIYTRRTDRPAGAEADAYPYALRKDGTGRWWLTHELDAHPVKNLATIEHAAREARR